MTIETLFAQITEHQPKLEGWCSMEKALTLASLVVSNRPLYTVEIGIYGGSSFVPLAMAHKAIGIGKVIGIDPWSKEAGVEAQTEDASREWWAIIDYAKLEGRFRGALQALDLNSVSTIIKKRSRDAEVPPRIDLLHIDGAHSDEAVTDVLRFAKNVPIGGIVVMDDLNWTGGGVTKAEARLLQMGFSSLFLLGTGAVYQKLK